MWYAVGLSSDGHKQKGFHSGVQLYSKVSSPKVLSSHHVHKSLNRVLIEEAILFRVNPVVPRRTVPKY